MFENYLQSVFTQVVKGCVEKQLDEVCTFSSGGTPPKNNASYWTGKIPWVSGRDMKSTRLSDSLLHISQFAADRSSTRMAPVGSLLILVRGMGLAHGAQIAELATPCAFNQDIKCIVPKADLVPRYLLFALRDKINSSETVLTNAAHGTLKIDSDRLQSIPVPVPPRQDQQRIVARIDSFAQQTQRLGFAYQQKLAALETLEKSLLHQVFAGEFPASRAIVVPFPIQIPKISTTDLHAGILAMACEFHEQNGKLRSFGHVKAEKIAHMVEASLGIELGRSPVKDAAGPNDFPHLKKVEHRARKTNCFDFKSINGAHTSREA